MLNILFVNGPAERGGGETVLINIVTNLDQTRFRPVVVFLRPGPLFEEFRQAGITTYLIDAKRFRNLWRTIQTISKLFLIIKREKIELIQSAGCKIHLYVGLAAFLSQKPAIILVQENLFRPGKWEKLARCIPSKLLIANSRATLETVKGFFKNHQVKLVYPGVDTTKYSSNPNLQLRSELGVLENEVVIGIFARLQRWKGINIFIEAANLVRHQNTQVRFFIVGGTLFEMEKDHLTELESQIQKLGLQTCLKMLGFRENVPQLMQAMDVVVSSSILPEGFGLTVVEAMLTGRPVVATAHGGPLEIIEDCKSGFLVTPGDPAALAERLLELISQPELRSQIGEFGRQEALRRFSMSKMVSQLETTYESLVNPAGY